MSGERGEEGKKWSRRRGRKRGKVAYVAHNLMMMTMMTSRKESLETQYVVTRVLNLSLINFLQEEKGTSRVRNVVILHQGTLEKGRNKN